MEDMSKLLRVVESFKTFPEVSVSFLEMIIEVRKGGAESSLKYSIPQVAPLLF